MENKFDDVQLARMPILSLAKEVRECSDVNEVADLLATGKWIAAYAIRNDDVNLFSLIRIY